MPRIGYDAWKHLLAPRDARHVQPVEGRAPGRKNTKRWCKGKKGRDHVPEIILANWTGTRGICHPLGWCQGRWMCVHIVACKTCGKHLGMVSRDDCPTWQALPARIDEWAIANTAGGQTLAEYLSWTEREFAAWEANQ